MFNRLVCSLVSPLGGTAAKLAVAVVLVGSMASAVPASAPQLQTVEPNVYQATLQNGLRVIVVRNTLAPAVATDMTYLVGSRDDPSDVPGMAHAQEHMMFRGTKNLSTSELGTLATALGGAFNAGTSDTLTQYQFTVPAADLDAVLRVEADRMRDVLDAQKEWQNERGAIEQEVSRDDSSPNQRFFQDVQNIALAGTPYAHDGVGTRAAFDALTGPRIKQFYEKWYAPNNAVFVIAGDVDPATTLAQVRARFDSIPRRAVPEHEHANLRPLKRTVLKRTWTLIYPFATVGYRMPGVESPDFLPSFVLLSIMDAQRGPLRPLADTGEALDAQFITQPYVPETQLAFAAAALNPGSDPSAMTARLEHIVAEVAKNGVPRELFETTKRQLINGQEESRNSLESLASDWATTLADDHEPSIVREQKLIADVTLADVDRVARTYFDPSHAIVAALTPTSSASSSNAPAPQRQGPENPLGSQPSVSHVPEWAASLLDHPSVPPSELAPVRTTLSNGISLIVQHETISNAVFVFGRVKSEEDLQEPQGKEGITSLLDAIYPYGTTTLDRVAFQRAQDDLDTEINAGTSFAMQSTPAQFERGIALLAQNELHPRLDNAVFQVAKERTLAALQTSLNSADTIATRRAAEKLLPAGDPALRAPTLASVGSISLDDVRAYHDAVLRPDLATIVVIGNISAEAAKNAVEKAFGAWHAEGPAPNLELPPVPVNPPAQVTMQLPIEQTFARFTQTVPLSATDADYYPLLVGNAIFGGGSTGPEQSRLFRDLRQNSGLVYNVSSSLGSTGKRSQFQVEFASSPSNVGRISSLIDAEIAKMQTEPVGAFELALVKASLVRRTIVGGASMGAIGGALLNDASNGLPLDQDERDAKQYLRADAPSIQAAFAKYVHPENFVRVIEGP
jgi:zinc protease